jgi:hypothetical protein
MNNMRYAIAYFNGMSMGNPEFDYLSDYTWTREGEDLKNTMTKNKMKVFFESSEGLLMTWGAIAIPETHHLFNVKLMANLYLLGILDKKLVTATNFFKDELLDMCCEVLAERKISRVK